MFGVYFFLLLGEACTNAENTNANQMSLINKAVTAFSKHDTLGLYNLIDTGKCFRIYGKDGFLLKVNYIYDRLKACGVSYNERKIRINPRPVNRTEYTIAFCRNTNDSIINDSFDLIFTFSNYDQDKVISFMDIKKYKDVHNTSPLSDNN